MIDLTKTKEFIVIKQTYRYSTCISCDGTGVTKRPFRKIVFIENCPHCEGKGRTRFTTKTEASLIDALKELNLIT